MKLKTFTHLVAFAAFAFASSNSNAQFTGEQDEDFGDSGNLWYDYTGSGATSVMTKLVLDENSESFYFSGSLYSSGFNAIVVKSDLGGTLNPDLLEGTINYDPFDEWDDQFESVAIQDNGKIVAVGYTTIGPGNSAAIVARFNVDGTFDPTFNGGSVFIMDAGGIDVATDVAIQEDGKIVVIGSIQSEIDNFDLFFVRLNSDGSPDGTFGEGASRIIDSYSGVESLTSVTILENGAIMAVGQSYTDALMVQLDTDGNLDAEFHGGSVLNFKVNSLPSAANKLIELSDGTLLLSGNNTNEEEDGDNGFVVKMERNGMFVFDFNGEDGTLILNFETEIGLDTNFTIRDMEVLSSGQILVAADYSTDTDDLALVLINPDGEIDTEFGENGMRLYNLSLGILPNFDSQIEVSSTGAVYLAGRVVSGEHEDIVTFLLFGDISGLYEENTTALDFNLYPNPTTNALNIEIDLTTSDDLSIQIVDLMGKVVASEQLMNVPAGQSTISISSSIDNLAAGSYWLHISTEGMTSTKLFVKK